MLPKKDVPKLNTDNEEMEYELDTDSKEDVEH